MHIAFAISSLHGGGAARVVLALTQSLIARGHRVDLVLFQMHIHYPGKIPAAARLFVMDESPDQVTADSPEYGALCKRVAAVARGYPKKVGRLSLMRRLKWNFRVIPTRDKFQKTCRIADYIEQENPDIILSSLISATVATLLAGYLLDKPPPVVLIIHNMMKRRRKWVPIKYSPLFEKAARVVAVSSGVADSVRRETGVSKQQLTAIHNPIIPLDLDQLKLETPQHPWFSDGGAPIILACGRLKAIKDFACLVNAFARLSKQTPCRLVIFGEGEERAALEDLVAARQLGQTVAFPGWVENPYAHMANASLFVLCSRMEGLPSVLIEALACGCACVSTNCPSGPAEILQDGVVGELVEVGNDRALADAMLRTLNNPPPRQRLVDRAAFYSVDRSVELYEKLMRDIVAK